LTAKLEPQIALPNLHRPASEVAPELLGCQLVRQWSDGQQVRAEIVEVEAYSQEEPGCHGHRGCTPRNRTLFGPPGQFYVYRIYGVYHCLNVVTHREGYASGVLIRALAIVEQSDHRIAAGPGKLCRCLEIDTALDSHNVEARQRLWLEPRHPDFQFVWQQGHIPVIQTTRIGLSQGQEIPWRWYLADSPAVSKRAGKNVPKILWQSPG
jgi:DNA-3-methyladenine glycosylase